MAQNNFIVDLIAGLKKAASKKQVQSDAKNLGDIKVPLIGTLNKSKTKAQLKQDLSSLNGTVNLTTKVNKKGIVTSVQQATQQAQTTANKNTIQVRMSLKKDKLINDIKVFGQQNTKLFKDANMTAKYNSLLDNAKLATSNKEIKNLRLQLSAMRSEIKATHLSGLTLGDTFKKTFKRATELFTGTGVVMMLSQQLHKAWTEAINLDNVYTGLIKVQDELTRGDYPEYLEKCNKKAQELATTQQSLIEGATEFSKSGYDLNTSDKLTEQSTILSNVGEMSASDSAKAIISGVQAYDVVDGYTDVVDKAQALIDKYNEIGNTASITTAEIAQGVQSVGSVFADANTSVDEFIALLAAGNRAYQDADSLALGLRTAALRIRGCTVELEQMGEETDGVYSSASKLQEKIVGLTNINGSGGVKILEADGETFRSIYDIFVDISKVYKDMSDTDQSALLELIAGKHRASGISATLNNMSEAQEIYQRSLEASGSAQEEYDKYLQSSEASLNKFKASMIETYQSVINGNTTKGILDAGNAALQFANNIGLVESSLKGLIAIGVVKAITMMSTAFKASAIQASNFGTALNTVNNMSSLTRGTTEYTNALNTLKTVSISLSEAQLKQVLANKTLSDSERVAILQTTGLTRAQAQAKLVQLGLTQSTKAQSAANATATASTFSLTAAVKGLAYSAKAVFMSNPIGISIMALSTAIGAISSAIDSANQKLEEARQKAVELANAYNQEKSSLDSQIEKYKELKETLDNSNLSTDETRSIKEQLLEIQKSLIDSYGNEASNIDLVNGKYKEQLGLLSELSKEKATDFVTENRDVFNDAKEALDEVRKFELGVVTSWNSYVPKTEEQQKLIEFLETYSDLLDLTYSYANDRNGYTATAVNLSVKANVENADEVMHQLAEDLEKYGKDNNIDVSGVLDNIPEQLRNIWTDELKDYKTIYDEFMKAEIIRNDTLRPLYQESIKAVEDYNNALSTGEGVKEAKANLDSVQQSVQNATGELEGSQDVFDGIYDGINKDAEAAYNLGQAFANDKTVQEYAEQLRGLSDIDLKAINFDNDNTEKGEEAFRGLMETLGLTEEQVQSLIDKLVELGYVQGKTSSDTSSTFTSFTDAFNAESFKDSAKALKELALSGQITPEVLTSTKEYKTLLEETGLSAEEAAERIRQIAIGESSLSDIMSSMQSHAKLLNTITEEIKENGEISFDTLKSIASQYPQLEKYVTNYLNGVAGAEEELVAELNKQYSTDLDNYKDYYTIKQQNDETWLTDYLTNTSTWVNELAKQYDIDLQNYGTYLKAKEELETKLTEAKQKKEKLESGKIQIDIQSKTTNPTMQGLLGGDFTSSKFGVSDSVENFIDDELSYTEQYIADIGKIIDDITSKFGDSLDNNVGNILDKFKNSDYIGSKSSSSSSKSFDWISTATKRADEELDTLNDKISDTYATWEERTQALKDAFDRVTKSIELQKQAAEAYKEEANKIDLPESYKTLIKDGALNAKDVVDSNLADKISEYQTLYEKSIECTKTAEELQNTLNEIATSKQWDLIKNQFSASLDEVDFRISEIQNSIDILEMKGLYADEKYYNDMIALTQKKKATLESEMTQLQSIMSNMTPGTEAYNKMFSELMDIRTEVSGLEKDIVDFNKTIRDLNWEVFEYLEESINRITDETEYLVGLLENKDLFDKNGNRTNYGDATIGLHAIAYETYKQQAQDYLEEANKLQKELVAGAGKDVLEQYNKMIQAHRDAINSALDEKNAILDLIEDGYQKQIDALDELIKKRQDALNAEKSLYDYQKNVKKQTDNISNLEKQQLAYNGDNSEEAMARAQQLKVQLEDARNELQETEYEQYLSDAQNMLDTLSTEFESWINGRLDNSDILFEQIIEQISMQGSSITDTLNSIAAENNTMISDSLSGITGSMDNYSSAVQTAIQGSLETTTQLITESNTSLTDSVSNSVSSSISTSLGITNGVISSAAGSIVSAENGTSSSVLQGASSIVGAIGSLGSSLSSSIYSMGSTIASSVSGAISGIKADVTKNANNISSLQGAISAIRSSLDALSSRVSSLQSNSDSSGGGGNSPGTRKENLSQVSTHYASGTPNAKKGLAWTQEDGQEYIITKDGALLTSLSGGELVLNNKASKLLYDFANSPEEFLRNMPSFVPNINLPSLDYSKIVPNNSREQKVDMNVGDITISLPNVTNYAEFRNELIKDKGFEKSILTTVNNAMMGKSTISKLKYVK